MLLLTLEDEEDHQSGGGKGHDGCGHQDIVAGLGVIDGGIVIGADLDAPVDLTDPAGIGVVQFQGDFQLDPEDGAAFGPDGGEGGFREETAVGGAGIDLLPRFAIGDGQGQSGEEVVHGSDSLITARVVNGGIVLALVLLGGFIIPQGVGRFVVGDGIQPELDGILMERAKIRGEDNVSLDDIAGHDILELGGEEVGHMVIAAGPGGVVYGINGLAVSILAFFRPQHRKGAGNRNALHCKGRDGQGEDQHKGQEEGKQFFHDRLPPYLLIVPSAATVTPHFSVTTLVGTLWMDWAMISIWSLYWVPAVG